MTNINSLGVGVSIKASRLRLFLVNALSLIGLSKLAFAVLKPAIVITYPPTSLPT